MTTRITASNANTAFVAKRQRELNRNHVRSQSVNYVQSSSPSNRAYRQRGTLPATSSTKVLASVVTATVSGPMEYQAPVSPVVRRSDMSNFYGLPTPARTDSLTQFDRFMLGEEIPERTSSASPEVEARHAGTLDSETWNALPVAQRMQLASSFAAPQLGLPLEASKGKPLMKAIKVLGDLKAVQSALQELEKSQAEFAKIQKRVTDAMARSGRHGDHSGSFRDLTSRMPVIIQQMKKLDNALWAVSADSSSQKTSAENAREAVKLARASLASSIKNLEAIYNVA